MRMKFPNVIAGSLAASAPIWQFPGLAPCDSYNKGVTHDFEVADETGKCAESIRRSWKEIDTIGQKEGGELGISWRWYNVHRQRLCASSLIHSANSHAYPIFFPPRPAVANIGFPLVRSSLFNWRTEKLVGGNLGRRCHGRLSLSGQLPRASSGMADSSHLPTFVQRLARGKAHVWA